LSLASPSRLARDESEDELKQKEAEEEKEEEEEEGKEEEEEEARYPRWLKGEEEEFARIQAAPMSSDIVRMGR
jgi:uncharacterized membrane protein YdbT with pleckstrin-like domain